MGNVLILMTALVPTMGHRDLITFATSLEGSRVKVFINGRAKEPVPGERRLTALREAFAGVTNVSFALSMNDQAPQNPEDHPAFWEWWRDEVNGAFPETSGEWEFVVASEGYGAPMAKILAAEFLPYDLERELNPARSTPVRAALWDQWDLILPEFRKNLQLKAVLFGQESVGKTTMSKALAKELACDWRFEYARPLLNALGPEVTHRNMELIHRGQAAVQRMAYHDAKAPALFLDTDLYSTVGYWGIMGEDVPAELHADAFTLRGDVYYMLPDDIPVEADPLRYGGDKRESDMQFWRDVLAMDGLAAVEVPSGSFDEKLAFIVGDVRARFQARHEAIGAFERE